MSEFENEEISLIDETQEPLIEENKIEETLEIIETPEVEKTPVEAIALEEPEEKTGKGLGTVANGAIGSTTVKTPKKKTVKTESTNKAEDKVAIHSTRNVTWQGVGKVYNGYNIVTKEQAEKWLTRNHTRLATPEEVAKEFGR